jgi:hypothetical protein
MKQNANRPLWKGLAVSAAVLLLGIIPARADTVEITDFQSDPAAVQALMQPIEPLIGGDAGSTTSINQVGQDNLARSYVGGQGSLSLIQQSGSNNRAIQAIDGNSSALLLVQGGTNNTVVQAAKGDRDFQLVGVSGNANQVAYIQVGDDLAGALDVTGSQNSTVIALQTPQSGRYLMPSGLSGLNNKIVIVVPGRMYVLPKR